MSIKFREIAKISVEKWKVLKNPDQLTFTGGA